MAQQLGLADRALVGLTGDDRISLTDGLMGAQGWLALAPATLPARHYAEDEITPL